MRWAPQLNKINVSVVLTVPLGSTGHTNTAVHDSSRHAAELSECNALVHVWRVRNIFVRLPHSDNFSGQRVLLIDPFSIVGGVHGVRNVLALSENRGRHVK